jgi:hypothetical protein
VAAATRMKQSSDYDEDSDDEPPVRRANAVKASPRGGGAGRGRGRPKKQVINDNNNSDSEEDDEDDVGKQKVTKGKQICQYGKACYRRVDTLLCAPRFTISFVRGFGCPLLCAVSSLRTIASSLVFGFY